MKFVLSIVLADHPRYQRLVVNAERLQFTLGS